MDTSRALGRWARRLACCGAAVALLCTASSAAAGKPKKPDLRITGSVRCVQIGRLKQNFIRQVLPHCTKGNRVEVEITVKNIGKKTSASVPWTLASSYGPFKKFGASATNMAYPTPQGMKKVSTGHLSQLPRQLPRMVPKLKRNEEFRQTVVLLRQGKRGLAVGTHSITFTVDPNNKVSESNEKNNDRKISLKVKKPPKYVTKKVKLIDITTPLVPSKLYGGDREFDGNGPIIDCKVTLRVSKNKRAIMADITFKAKETKSDWSETRGSWTRTVYKKPKGRKIVKIFGPKVSKVHFKSKPGGFQLLGPTADFITFLRKLNEIAEAVNYVVNPVAHATRKEHKELFNMVDKGLADLPAHGNLVHVRRPAKGPVSVFAIVGDTGGDDISKDNNPKDDTRIQAIKFKRLKIRFK